MASPEGCIVLHVLRHGEYDFDSRQLTVYGGLQAQAAAWRFYQRHRSLWGRPEVRVLYSPNEPSLMTAAEFARMLLLEPEVCTWAWQELRGRRELVRIWAALTVRGVATAVVVGSELFMQRLLLMAGLGQPAIERCRVFTFEVTPNGRVELTDVEAETV